MKNALPALVLALFATLGNAAAATDWSETVPPKAAQADLAALYDGLKSAHYNLFVHRSRADYDARFAETMADLRTPLTRFELFLALQRFTAYGQVAHARIGQGFARPHDEHPRGVARRRRTDGNACLGQVEIEGVDTHGFRPPKAVRRRPRLSSRRWSRDRSRVRRA